MSYRPILVIGASGQIGKTLARILGNSCIRLTRQQLDLSKIDELEQELDKYDVSAVINAGAYTLVDRAEQEESIALKVNGYAPGIIAGWCAKQAIPFVHYSTDYVFSGKGNKPWMEEDLYAPVNAYGRTKRKVTN